ncbi:MAG: ferrochelatase [Planctomycetaceae bacterium]
MDIPYDAILVVSFGGPESRDDVIPFLENVLRGRNVPRERMLEVAEHYYHFDGISPINAQNREFIAALKPELERQQIDLPVFWGNRNWHPLLEDTLREMSQQGVKRALAFVTSAYSSYSGCRQYREDIERAREAVGPEAPQVEKLRVFYNHPDFIAANVDRLREAIHQIPQNRHPSMQIAYTAHSIPDSMANTSDYVQQLEETCRLVSEELDLNPAQWKLVYQSRSGRPTDPWLEPDILDDLKQKAESGTQDVVIVPVGFLSDHMEVLYDLDYEAKTESEKLGLNMVRAGTVGTHPRFLHMVAKLIQERIQGTEREAIGCFGPNHDVCPIDCCPRPVSPGRGGRPASSL